MRIIENLLFGKNILDIIIVITLIFSGIRSFLKGIVHEVFSLLALVLGIVFARRLFHQAAQIWGGADSSWIINVAVFVLLFLAAYIIITLLGMLLRGIIKTAQFGWLDHLGGMILGLAKGYFLLCLLIAILVLALPSDSHLIQTSRLAPFLFQSTSFLMKYAPSAVKLGFQRKLEEIQHPEKNLRKKKNNNPL
ncbi:MAG: CvpA family protein [bacterium]